VRECSNWDTDLSAYATLCDEAEIQDPQNLTCYLPKLGRAPLPKVGAKVVTQPALARGRATLAVAVEPAAAVPWAFQVKVDRGPWSRSAPAVDGQLEVASPRLFVAGMHAIELRARIPGNDTVASAPVTVQVDVPPVAWLSAAPPSEATAAAAADPPAAPFGCQATPTSLSLLAALFALRPRHRL
jgi:hypothetical protein